MEQCFSKDALIGFFNDGLPELEKQSIVNHLEHCLSCQEEANVFSNDEELADWRQSLLDNQSLESNDVITIPEPLIQQLYELPSAETNTEHDIAKTNTRISDGSNSIPKDVPKSIGQYQLMRIIGRGGIGTVYEAFHCKLKRRTAVKLLNFDRIQSQDSVRRFYREMEAIGHLDHPNIVRAIDAGEINGNPYLVMEYVVGSDLAKVVSKAGPLSVVESCEIIRQAACGLQHAHDNGLIHRDIKPSNLLLDLNGHVKVADLGLAQFHEAGSEQSEITKSNHLMGTVDFMSPEQALNPKHADERSDIYSLGCTLYFLLTGKPVYKGDSILERILAHREHVVPSIREFLPNLTEKLDVVINRLLAKLPEDRFQSMDEVRTVLETFVNDVQSTSSKDEKTSRTENDEAVDAFSVNSMLREKVRRVFDETVDVQAYDTRTVTVTTSFDSTKLSRSFRKSLWSSVVLGFLIMVFVGYAFFSRDFLGFISSRNVPDDKHIDQPTHLGESSNKIFSLQVKGNAKISSIGYFADGRRIFCGTGNTVQIWDLETHKLVREFETHPQEVLTVALSPDENRILTGSKDGKIRLFDINSGQNLLTLFGHKPAGVTSIAFLLSGEQALSASWDGTVRVWDLNRGKQVNQFRVGEKGIYSATVSHDNQLSLIGSRDKKAYLLDLELRKVVFQFPHADWVVSTAISYDGQLGLTGSWDKTACVWDLKTGKEILKITADGKIEAVAFTHDGHRVIIGDDVGRIQVWDIKTKKPLATIHDDNLVEFIAVSPDNRIVLTSTGKVSGRIFGAIRGWQLPKPDENDL